MDQKLAVLQKPGMKTLKSPKKNGKSRPKSKISDQNQKKKVDMGRTHRATNR